MNGPRLIRELFRRPLFRIKIDNGEGRLTLDGDWSSLIASRDVREDMCYVGFTRDISMRTVQPMLIVNPNACVLGPFFRAVVENTAREYDPFYDGTAMTTFDIDDNVGFGDIMRHAELDMPRTTKAFVIPNAAGSVCMNRHVKFRKILQRGDNGAATDSPASFSTSELAPSAEANAASVLVDAINDSLNRVGRAAAGVDDGDEIRDVSMDVDEYNAASNRGARAEESAAEVAPARRGAESPMRGMDLLAVNNIANVGLETPPASPYVYGALDEAAGGEERASGETAGETPIYNRDVVVTGGEEPWWDRSGEHEPPFRGRTIRDRQTTRTARPPYALDESVI